MLKAFIMLLESQSAFYKKIWPQEILKSEKMFKPWNLLGLMEECQKLKLFHHGSGVPERKASVFFHRICKMPKYI